MIANSVRRLIGLSLVFALLGASPMPATSQDGQYESLAQSFYMTFLKMNPLAATFVGIHDYDAELGDFSAAGVQKELALDHDTWTKLQAIDRSTLSPSVALDATLLGNSIQDDILNNDTLAQWRHNPDGYTQSASGAIFSLMQRDYAPLKTRMQYAISREREIPAMLMDGEHNTTTVDAVTQRIAYEDAAGSVDFFKTSVPLAFDAVKDASLQAQLKQTNAAVMKAMGAYAAWIKKLHPSGTYAIGADAYRAKLKYEDALDMSLDQYLAYGENALKETRAQFVATAHKINPKASPLAVYLALAKDHPAPNKLLDKARTDLVALRAFIEAKHIVTLPANANITVVETPPFERQTTTASEDSPGPLETVALQSFYNVTPVDPTWNKKQTEDYLAQFNNYEFPIISAHEVYPGHFTNFSIDRNLDLSLTRKMNVTSEFAEGWAHYSEQMMVDEGWGNGDPRVRLSQLEEALLRECRYIVGVRLHTQGMTLKQAEKTFVTQCYQTPQVAVEESLRGTQDPMYGYYTLGKLMILKLRSDYKKMMGSAYTLQKFHDELLSRGDPPLPLLRPFILGKSDDGQPL